MKSFKDFINEDGVVAGSAGPTNTVGGVAGTNDSRLPSDQRLPGVNIKRKKSPVMMNILKRKSPKL